jgi:hypothetical protein
VLLGFDLDNTLFDYSEAVQMAGWDLLQIPPSSKLTKEILKQTVQKELGDVVWTELQGLLYTAYLKFVTIDSQALELLRFLKHETPHEIQIVSHKTEFPIIGPRVNMRDLATQTFCNLSNRYLGEDLDMKIVYQSTLADKITYINNFNFAVFVDDLWDVISNLRVKHRIFFTSSRDSANDTTFTNSWTEITAIIKEVAAC